MENAQSNRFLGEGKISKLLLKFSIPCILSLLISALYNIVDQIFIGNSELGYLGNAATSVVFPITIIAMAFAWCFGDGAAAFMSIRQGNKNTKDVDRAVGNCLLASLAASLLFMLVCFLAMNPILYAFGASEQTITLARNYFIIILAAVPVFMLMNTCAAIIRADGSPLTSMLIMLAGAVTNIILDPVFIFVFKWGIEGAAYATIIGQGVSFVTAAAYFFKTKTFKLKLNSFAPNFRLLGDTVKLGLSTFITQMAIVAISLACNIMLSKHGAASKYGADIPIAVIGIVMKVFTIVINIVVGIILGAQPILGYNYGAGRYDRVKETYKLVTVAVVIICAAATLIFELFPGGVARIFGAGGALYTEFAEKTFRIFLMFVLFTCVIKMTSIFFQAVGHPAKAAIVSLGRDIVCFVPLVLILPNLMGIEGALWAAPIADVIGMALTAALIIVFFKKHSYKR